VRCFAERPANIDTMFRAAVARAPDRAALVLDDTRVTIGGSTRKPRLSPPIWRRRGLPKATVSRCCSQLLEFVYAVLGAARGRHHRVPMSIRQRAPRL